MFPSLTQFPTENIFLPLLIQSQYKRAEMTTPDLPSPNQTLPSQLFPSLDENPTLLDPVSNWSLHHRGKSLAQHLLPGSWYLVSSREMVAIIIIIIMVTI